MTKEIDRVVIFYKDGTFTEIKNVTPVKEFGDRPVTDPLDKNFPWPTIPVVTPPCSKCGMTGRHSCARSDCPTGWGSPWYNRDKVVD